MKKLIIVMIAILTNHSIAAASGCSWDPEYETAEKINADQIIKVVWVCNRSSTCYLFDIANGDHYSSEKYSYPEFPEDGVSIPVIMETFAAMEWFNCDGSDTPPAFRRDGVLKIVNYKGHNFKNYQKK